MGSLEELTISKRRALELMGVQINFERGLESRPSIPPQREENDLDDNQGAAVAAVNPPAPKTVESEVPKAHEQESAKPGEPVVEPAKPIRFEWVKSSGGLLCVDQFATEYQAAIQDIVRYMDWRAGIEPGAQLKRDTFQWPQLTFTDAGPQRPLTVFFEKYAPSESAWMIVDRYVADEVLTHLVGAMETKVIVIDELAQAIADPAAKRALWLKLAK